MCIYVCVASCKPAEHGKKLTNVSQSGHVIAVCVCVCVGVGVSVGVGVDVHLHMCRLLQAYRARQAPTPT